MPLRIGDNAEARVLLTTFSETLASALRTKLVRLIGTEPRLRERIDIDPLDAVARRLVDLTALISEDCDTPVAIGPIL